jgi:hypothetical protein
MRAGAEGEARKGIVSMARNKNAGGWSFKEDRRLVELTSSSKSPEEIARLISRSPEAVRKAALRLGISFKKRRNSAPTERLKAAPASLSSDAMLKVKGKFPTNFIWSLTPIR